MLQNTRILRSLCICTRKNLFCRKLPIISSINQNHQVRGKRNDANLSTLFKPVPIRQSPDDINIGAELTGGTLDKVELLKIVNKFTQKREIKMLCMENGLDSKMKMSSLERIITYIFDS